MILVLAYKLREPRGVELFVGTLRIILLDNRPYYYP